MSTIPEPGGSTRYLIVNGDDLGLSAEVSRGILEAHRRGILTSASLMVYRAASETAAALAREAPDLSVGLHLDLDGAAGVALRAAVEGQLDRFERLMGRLPTHLDSHDDAHHDPRVLPDVLGLARRLGIPLRGLSLVAPYAGFYGRWGGETTLERVSVESLLDFLDTKVREGVTELVCHPGYVDSKHRSRYAVEREAELRTLCDPRAAEALDHAGIELVGFRDLAILVGSFLERETDRPEWGLNEAQEI